MARARRSKRWSSFSIKSHHCEMEALARSGRAVSTAARITVLCRPLTSDGYLHKVVLSSTAKDLLCVALASTTLTCVSLLSPQTIIPTYHFQDSLPKLVLPKLGETLERVRHKHGGGLSSCMPVYSTSSLLRLWCLQSSLKRQRYSSFRVFASLLSKLSHFPGSCKRI